MLKCALLCLPREVRDIIYAHALPERLRLVSRSCKESLDFYESSGVLLANHQIRREALDALERQLATTTIIATYDAHLPPLRSPEYANLRQKIQNLIIQISCRKRNLSYFALSPQHGWRSQEDLYLIRQELPSLRYITFEITWEPNEASTVLWRRAKEHMVMVLKRMVGGEEFWDGWDVDSQIIDATRWKSAWSGVVAVKKH
jgi:hypothetical protein